MVDHCNAHSGEQRYRLQRVAFIHHPWLKARPDPEEIPWPPAPAPLPECKPGAGLDDSGEENEEDGYDSEGFRSARVVWTHGLSRADRPPRPKQPMQPVQPSHVLPDPALDDKLLEIGTIRLPIKVS